MSNDDVNKAIAALAKRVVELEKGAPVTAESRDATDVRPVLVATLADLKKLRTSLLTCKSEVDEKLVELDEVKTENGKLKYQIKHLKRSLAEAGPGQ